MYQNIKIEKGLPIPEHKSGSGIVNILQKMSIGDSFLIPDNGQGRKLQSAISAQCNQYSKDMAFKFTVRRVEGGYRVWMISRDTTT